MIDKLNIPDKDKGGFLFAQEVDDLVNKVNEVVEAVNQAPETTQGITFTEEEFEI